MVCLKKQGCYRVMDSALGLGAGILLTFLVSPRTLIVLEAAALVAVGAICLICRR